MLDSTKTQHSATSRFLHIISTLYIEFFILLICTLVISQTGKSTGPVFDVVGPDLIPLTVAYVVAALTLLQLVVESRKMDFAGRQMNGDIGFRPIPCLLFCCLSGLYVLSLANAWAGSNAIASVNMIFFISLSPYLEPVWFFPFW